MLKNFVFISKFYLFLVIREVNDIDSIQGYRKVNNYLDL